jgi:hypothetical protein
LAGENPQYRNIAPAEKTRGVKEIANIEIERKIAKTQLDSHKIIKEIDPASKFLKHQESTAASLG